MGGRGAKSGVKNKNAERNTEPAKSTFNGTLTISDKVISGADEASLKKLAEMAKAGELPSRIEGSTAEQARIFEEIDRLYPAPPGVMSRYNVHDYGGSSLVVDMTYGLVAGENPPDIRLPRRNKASEAERSGAIKYAIYKHRGPMEMAATCRQHGYPTYDMANKWGGRILSNAEKAQVDREIEAHVQNLFNSPMSREGMRLNAGNWVQQGGGWRRSEDPAFTRDLVERTSEEVRRRWGAS